MQDIKDKLIVALDVDTLEEAAHFVDLLYPKVKMFKVGSHLFTSCGPEAVKMFGRKGAHIFLDLKFHDIPNTVFLASAAATALNHGIVPKVPASEMDVRSLAIFMLTVHTSGGKEMLEAAVKGAQNKAEKLGIARPFIVGVTVLTSESNEENIKESVLRASGLAKDSGLDGVVASVHEAALIRKEFGRDFLIVTPGIRPKGWPSDDQSRVATAEEAIAAGADYIVVGRPILKAKDPPKAMEDLL